ncbi:polyprenol monophosphomannose synthase [Armatimonas sp.]|uniref:polyprenol monophosphomannose synthase n=1 Tax=Armatimonas sp. TaxID=1872638 RepID=UPI0037510AAA
MSESTLIVIPTYNEKENVVTLVTQLRQNVPEAHLLIVDDGSPDGTGSLVDGLAASDPQVHVLHRTTKDGLGRAYVAGFTWGLARDYDRLVQMDADLSHNPCDVPRLLAADADLVIGSRYVPGGGTVNWGAGRRILSRGGCLYARTILGLPLQDLTGGFKCWRRAALEAVNLPEIRSNGYSFQIEMTWRALQAGFKATEVPIVFTDRIDGVSKMSKRIVFEAVGLVWRLRLTRPAAHQ